MILLKVGILFNGNSSSSYQDILLRAKKVNLLSTQSEDDQSQLALSVDSEYLY